MYLAGCVAFVMLGRRRGNGDLVEKGYGQVSHKVS
ncbi:hypothetical protein BURK2_00500 [Burkholderiales bacterium]|nr:hypothetical protein BURK2_00500 [Burkholderiales bacterium]